MTFYLALLLNGREEWAKMAEQPGFMPMEKSVFAA